MKTIQTSSTTQKLDTISVEILKKIDPSNNYVYVQWLCDQFVIGHIDINNALFLQRLKSALAFYHRPQLKALLSNSEDQINNFDSPATFFQFLEPFFNNKNVLTPQEIKAKINQTTFIHFDLFFPTDQVERNTIIPESLLKTNENLCLFICKDFFKSEFYFNIDTFTLFNENKKEISLVKFFNANKDIYRFFEKRGIITLKNWDTILKRNETLEVINTYQKEGDTDNDHQLLMTKYEAYIDYVTHMTENKARLFAGFKSKKEFEFALSLFDSEMAMTA